MIKILTMVVMLSASLAIATPSITMLRTEGGDNYGLVMPHKAGPLALIFTTTSYSSLSGEFTSIGTTLSQAGFVVASLDLPCHGSEANGRLHQIIDRITKGKGAADGLGCWASQVAENKGDFFAPFLERVKRVVSDLRARKLIAGDRIAVIGVSRGGYIALRAAAFDERITDVVGLAPVTDLQRLEEFGHVKVDESVYGLGKDALQLARRHLFLQIGSADSRVGTHQALQLVDAIIATGSGNKLDMTFIVTPEPGHVTAEHERAARWVIDEMGSAATMSQGSPPPPK